MDGWLNEASSSQIKLLNEASEFKFNLPEVDTSIIGHRSEIDKNIEEILYSPKLTRRVQTDDREPPFIEEISKIGSFNLKLKPKIGEACHLALEKENKILTDQSGSSIEECIRSDLVIDTNQQVHVFNDNYDERKGFGKEIKGTQRNFNKESVP